MDKQRSFGPIGASLVVLLLLIGAQPAHAQSSEIAAEGRFTNGRGACDYGPHYTDQFLFEFGADSGEGVISVHIFQESTEDEADGTLNSDGEINIRSSSDVYEGTISGAEMVADYTFVDLENGCRHEWDSAFAFESPPPIPEPVEVVEPSTPAPVETPDETMPGMTHTPGVAMDETSDDDQGTNPIGWGLLALGLVGVIAWLLLRRTGPTPAPAGGAGPAPKGRGPSGAAGQAPRDRDKRGRDKREPKDRKGGQPAPSALDDIRRERRGDKPSEPPRPQPASGGRDRVGQSTTAPVTERKPASPPAPEPRKPESPPTPPAAPAPPAATPPGPKPAPVPSPASGRGRRSAGPSSAGQPPTPSGPRPSSVLGASSTGGGRPRHSAGPDEKPPKQPKPKADKKPVPETKPKPAGPKPAATPKSSAKAAAPKKTTRKKTTAKSSVKKPPPTPDTTAAPPAPPGPPPASTPPPSGTAQDEAAEPKPEGDQTRRRRRGGGGDMWKAPPGPRGG